MDEDIQGDNLDVEQTQTAVGSATSCTTTSPSDLPVATASSATIDDVQIEAIVGGYHGAPFDVLGPQSRPSRIKRCW